MANCPSMVKPTKPHFLKTVTEGTLQDMKLMIPRKFVKKYGNDLLSSPEVVLMVPDGVTWLVGVTVTESDGNVWLQNGWDDFVKYYSLQPLHILLFKYKGNSKFRVFVLDASAASEIEYPCRVRQNGKQKQKTSVEVNGIENPSRVGKDKGKRPVEVVEEEFDNDESSSDESKDEEANDEISSDESDELWCDEESEDESSSESDELCCRRQKSQSLSCRRPPKMPKTISTGRGNTSEGAHAFESENPFFVVEMRPSNFIDPVRRNTRNNVVIPSKFIKQYLKEKAGHISLCTPDGQTWSAKYLHYRKNRKYPKAVMDKGWVKFMLDNKLELGDVCVFELIDQSKFMFKVTIYPATHDSNHHSSFDGPLSSHKKAIAFERASSFRSANPFFKVVMQPTYLRAKGKGNFVYIPYKFSKTYLDGKDQVILQVSDGRSWTVKHCVPVSAASGQHKPVFKHDWSAFVQDNKLKIGDVCVFELINQAEASFKVSIY